MCPNTPPALRAPTHHERQRLAAACFAAAVAFYPLPAVRSGALELLLFFRVLAGRAQVVHLLAIESLVAALFLLPAVGFWLWSRPRFDRPGLPRRSLVLLGLLLAYVPIQAIFSPQLFGPEELGQILKVDAALPVIAAARHLDKPILLALVIWTWRQRYQMSAAAQLTFHFLLAVCFVWALSSFVDAGFGYYLQFRLEVLQSLAAAHHLKGPSLV